MYLQVQKYTFVETRWGIIQEIQARLYPFIIADGYPDNREMLSVLWKGWGLPCHAGYHRIKTSHLILK